MSLKIGSTDLTVRWLQDELQKCFQTKSNIEDWSMEELGEGSGYLSQVLRIGITWKPEDKSLPGSVVLKVSSSKQFQRMIETGKVPKELHHLGESDKKRMSSVRYIYST